MKSFLIIIFLSVPLLAFPQYPDEFPPKESESIMKNQDVASHEYQLGNRLDQAGNSVINGVIFSVMFGGIAFLINDNPELRSTLILAAGIILPVSLIFQGIYLKKAHYHARRL